ncbi:MAG: glycerate kinase [Muribaculum sp.]|nr:glycerate kinase [Muribaculum sp.]
MKVVVAIDSMKGCLGSGEASEACAMGVRERMPGAEVISVPVADGGEGTAAAIAFSREGLKRRKSRVQGPDGREVDAEWWMDEENKKAYMDMAAAVGLMLLAEDKRNPMKTTTYGVGQLILAAMDEGAKNIVVGMGGSATVDGGVGACEALGVRFIKNIDFLEPEQNASNTKDALEIGGDDIRDIDISGIDSRLKDVEILLACDVTAPFTGEKGAARVFGPQKGANPVEVELLETRLENIREIILKKFGHDLNTTPASGAAGGCAGGLVALVGAKIKKGAELVLDSIGFDKIIEDADMIITGEGSADIQTLMGKLPFEILQRGKQKKIPVILVAGKIEDKEKLEEAGFAKVIDINSEETAFSSNTSGKDAMNPAVASSRLCHINAESIIKLTDEIEY